MILGKNNVSFLGGNAMIIIGEKLNGSIPSVAKAISEKDADGNALIGPDIQAIECRNCIVHTVGEKRVVIQGLEDCIVAERDGVLLICKLSEEQRIKEWGK